MLRRLVWAALPVIALTATAGHAQTRLATTVSSNVTSAGYTGNINVLNDSVYPPNGQYYQTDTVSNYASTTNFRFDFGSLASVGSFNLNVDNNDDYRIAFYNGDTLVTDRTITRDQGVVGGGVETFSSDPTLPGTYLANLALGSPVQATNARILSTGGDGLYSIGEAEFFTPAAVTGGVPEPATWAMMVMGMGLAGFTVRRSYRRSEERFNARVRRIAAGELL